MKITGGFHSSYVAHHYFRCNLSIVFLDLASHAGRVLRLSAFSHKEDSLNGGVSLPRSEVLIVVDNELIVSILYFFKGH